MKNIAKLSTIAVATLGLGLGLSSSSFAETAQGTGHFKLKIDGGLSITETAPLSFGEFVVKKGTAADEGALISLNPLTNQIDMQKYQGGAVVAGELPSNVLRRDRGNLGEIQVTAPALIGNDVAVQISDVGWSGSLGEADGVITNLNLNFAATQEQSTASNPVFGELSDGTNTLIDVPAGGGAVGNCQVLVDGNCILKVGGSVAINEVDGAIVPPGEYKGQYTITATFN